MALSEFLNLPIWAKNSPPLTYLNGILLFVAGLAIVRVHNYWVFSWPVVVTLVGWLCIGVGLFRIFFPEATQAGDNAGTHLLLAVLFATGLFLTFKAYLDKRAS